MVLSPASKRSNSSMSWPVISPPRPAIAISREPSTLSVTSAYKEARVRSFRSMRARLSTTARAGMITHNKRNAMSANSNKPGDMKPATATSKTPTIHAMSTGKTQRKNRFWTCSISLASEPSTSPVRQCACSRCWCCTTLNKRRRNVEVSLKTQSWLRRRSR